MGLRRWLSFVRPQDLVWLLLCAGLAALGPERNTPEVVILSSLAIFQVLESKIRVLSTPRGHILSILVKLGLGYLLIGFTGGVASSYYLILLLPIMSAATTLGAIGTFLIDLLSCASYLSFLLPVYFDWERLMIPPEEVYELGLRLAF